MATIQDFANIGINLKSGRNKQKVSHCPNCIKLGKRNINDTSLSINIAEGLYKCHKCNFSGKVGEQTTIVQHQNFKTYQKPSTKNITKLTEQGVQFFENRKIPQSVVVANKIAMTKDKKGMVFPYLRDGQLINYKARFIDKKDFRQAYDAEPIMFNYDRIKNAKHIIINEGEIDAMSWEVAGIEWHTSVNQGAPNVNDTNIEKKLECLTNSYDAFEQAELVYIGVDNDPNGRRLQAELIRRVGVEKVKLIDYSPYKDANEYLIEKGAFELKKLLDKAVEPKVEGVFKAEDKWDNMKDSFYNGKVRGTSTYFQDIDQHWTWRGGEVNVWTGYENEGKSTFLEQLCVIKSAFDGWKWAIFSPENTPIEDFYDNLIEMFIGMSADPYYKSNQMSFEEYQLAYQFVNEHFFIIYPEENFKLSTILDKARYLVRKYGVKGMVIDPYNALEHLQKNNEREELYIARFMGKLKRFAVDENLSMNLVAHQNTQRKNEKDGGRYDKPIKSNIKGGGVFAQRADNVNVVWRPNMALDFSDPEVMFASQKIKKQKLVGIPGEVHGFMFLRKSNRYYLKSYNPLIEVDKKRLGDKYVDKKLELPTVSTTEAFADDNDDDLPF